MDTVKIKSDRGDLLKFLLNEFERDFILGEVYYSRNYFPKINSELDFKIEEGNTVIDIGANVGIFSILASNLSRSGKVFAFEPVKANYDRLVSHKELNNSANLITDNRGVSNKNKKVKIHLLNDNSGGHSLNKKKFSHLQESASSIEMIQCTTLKDIFDSYNIAKCDFLKMDCEGEEYKILNALPSSYYDRINMIAIEFHHPVVSEIKLAKLLVKHGFIVTISDFGNVLGMVFAKKRLKRNEN